MADKIQLRRDSLDNWQKYNPILAEGEMGCIISEDGYIRQHKIGDGVHNWNDLPLSENKPMSTTITIDKLNNLTLEDLVEYIWGDSAKTYLRLTTVEMPELSIGTVQIIGNLSSSVVDILCFTALQLDAEGNLNPSVSSLLDSYIYVRHITFLQNDQFEVSAWKNIHVPSIDILDLENLDLQEIERYTNYEKNPYIQVSAISGIESSTRTNNMGLAQIFKQSDSKYCVVLHTTFIPQKGSFTSSLQSVPLVSSETLHTYYCFIYEGTSSLAPGRQRTNWVDRVDTLETKVNNKVDKVNGKGLSTLDFTLLEKNAIESARKVFHAAAEITWDSTKNANDYYHPATWRIKGERTNNADNLPIGNVGSGHTLDGILYVFNSSLTSGTGQTDDCTITQLLVLSNRVGGQEGGQWIRSGYGVNTGSLTWKPWAKMQTNMEVGVVNDTMQLMDSAGNQTLNASLGMDSLVDNGIYSGAYIPGSGTTLDIDTETFVMVVINNYAVAGEYKTMCQIKLGLETKGEFQFKRRHKLSSGWTAWTAVATGGGGSIIVQ